MKIDNTIVKSFRGFRTLGLFGILFCLIGCSGEQIDGPGNEPQPATEKAIAFSADLPEESEEEAMTRAGGTQGLEEVLPDGNKKFTVWGYKNMSLAAGVYGDLQTVFPGYIVNWEANTAATTTSNTHDWEYVAQQTGTDPEQTIKYWDFKAEAYRFFAVTNYAGEDTSGPYETNKAYGDDRTNEYRITMLADASTVEDGEGRIDLSALNVQITNTPYYSRLWFSTNELPTYSDKQFGKPVTLEFVKPYSRVRFMFTYSYPREGIRLKEPTFKPTMDYDVVPPATATRIPTAGTFTVIYPLTGTETSESFTIPSVTGTMEAFTEDYDPDNDGKDYKKTDEGWYTVLPNNTQGSYKLSVEINKTSQTCVVPEQYMQWLPGYSYTYIFKITEQGGVEIEMVQSAVIEWASVITRVGQEHELHNW